MGRSWALGILLVASTGLVAGCGDDSPEKAVQRINSGSLNTECLTSVRALQDAADLAYASTGTYPATIGELVSAGFVAPSDTISVSTGTTFSQTSAVGTYVVTMTLDGDGFPTIKGTVDGSPC